MCAICPNLSWVSDADHDFEMKYITIRGRGNILARIKKESQKRVPRLSGNRP